MTNAIRNALFAVLCVSPLQPAWATHPVRTTTHLGTQRASCSYPDIGFVVPKGEPVVLEIEVDDGITIDGWACTRGLCSQQVEVSEGYIEVLRVNHPDPSRLGGLNLTIDVQGVPERPELLTCCVIACDLFGCNLECDWCKTTPVCCACPCDFAPDCG
jgi:hypothetical protein